MPSPAEQADIERIAFAAQLSQEFWRRAQRAPPPQQPPPPQQQQLLPPPATKHATKHASGESPPATKHASGEWSPPALLWLVQRDFLQGGSVQAYLDEALAPRPAAAAAAADAHAQALEKVRLAFPLLLSPSLSFSRLLTPSHTSIEKVRLALAPFRGSMRAMGLAQPHVRRTELCQIPRAQYEPAYLSGLAEVREYVARYATPKGGGTVSGAAFAALASRLVDALNAREIPEAVCVWRSGTYLSGAPP